MPIVKILIQLLLNFLFQLVDKKLKEAQVDNAHEKKTVPVEEKPINKEIVAEKPSVEQEEVELEVKEDKPEEVKSPSYYHYILDPGHGINTKGKRSPAFSWKGQPFVFYEYAFNRQICTKLIDRFKQENISFSVTTPDYDIPTNTFISEKIRIDNFLKGRVDVANTIVKRTQKPCLFISIHSNAGPVKNEDKDWTTAEGVETWYYNDSNDQYGHAKGDTFAEVFQRKLVIHSGLKNRGLKARLQQQFYVLVKTKCPAILLELGFYNNRTEVEKLLDEQVQNKIIDGLMAAVKEIEQGKI